MAKGVLLHKKETRDGVDEDIEDQEEERIRHKREGEDEIDEIGQHLWQGVRNHHANCVLNVPKDKATIVYSRDDGGKVVVGANDICRLLCNIGAAKTHGDADMRGLERRRVADTITGDSHDFAAPLELLDKQELLLGLHARKDKSALVENHIPLVVCECLEIVAHVHGLICFVVVIRKDATLPCNCSCSDGEVARDHHHLDASGLALLDGIGHTALGWVEHGDKPGKAGAADHRIGESAGGLDVAAFLRGDVCIRKSNHALALECEFGDALLHIAEIRCVNGVELGVPCVKVPREREHDFGASLDDEKQGVFANVARCRSAAG
eukprot:comp12099_c0_seq1/m.15561 comp12099_c0_seq1/g.15561  ORF comp12099_c0_seq1/g.15561 comp12099_c0_seq1/m.15561 type:complete len:323 (+) comp12099_c0_seq1:121-1089(+)